MSLPSAAQLRKAADLTEKIEKLQSELAALLGEGGAAPAKKGRGSKKAKRAMSAEAREKIAAAQRKRWAKNKRAVKKAAATKE